MILTEEEARKRWCFKAISLHSEQGWYVDNTGRNHSYRIPVGVNRDTPQGNIPACIASHCMGWRWAEPKKIRDIDLVTSDIEPGDPRTGYCGLAGRPEHE